LSTNNGNAESSEAATSNFGFPHR